MSVIDAIIYVICNNLQPITLFLPWLIPSKINWSMFLEHSLNFIFDSIDSLLFLGFVFFAVLIFLSAFAFLDKFLSFSRKL